MSYNYLGENFDISVQRSLNVSGSPLPAPALWHCQENKQKLLSWIQLESAYKQNVIVSQEARHQTKALGRQIVPSGFRDNSAHHFPFPLPMQLRGCESVSNQFRSAMGAIKSQQTAQREERRRNWDVLAGPLAPAWRNRKVLPWEPSAFYLDSSIAPLRNGPMLRIPTSPS